MSIQLEKALSRKDVESLLTALGGDLRTKKLWIEKLSQWCDYQDVQIKIYNLIKEWLTDKCKTCGWHLVSGAYPEHTEEEKIDDYVYYQLEYTHAFMWCDKEKKVIINKYAVQPSLLGPERAQELLAYLNSKLEKP